MGKYYNLDDSHCSHLLSSILMHWKFYRLIAVQALDNVFAKETDLGIDH